MSVLYKRLIILFFCFSVNHLTATLEISQITLNHFSIVECETGEVFKIDKKYEKYKRALTDLNVVYIEDLSGEIRSFEVGENNTLRKTQIYRMPILSSFYNLVHKNSYKLKTPTCFGRHYWAMSRTMYDDDPNCTTVSVFELTCPYPIVIRNRDPWLYPSQEFLHKGPQDVYGVHITAIDKWVAISGYNRFFQRVVAYKKLNYDIAGHNFLASYETPTSKWPANRFYKWVAKKIGISQTPYKIPNSDWIIKRLPPFANPNILLKKIGMEIILCVSFEEGRGFPRFYNLETFVDKKLNLAIKTHKSFWPDEHLFQSENIMKRAILNGKSGTYMFSSQEPIDGVFMDDESYDKIEIYKIITGPIDFLTNAYTYVDSNRTEVHLEFLE